MPRSRRPPSYRATVRNHAKLAYGALSAWIECGSRFLAAASGRLLRRVERSPVRCLRIVEVARKYGERLPKTPDSVALGAFLAKRHRADPLRFPRRRPRAGSSPAWVSKMSAYQAQFRHSDSSSDKPQPPISMRAQCRMPCS